MNVVMLHDWHTLVDGSRNNVFINQRRQHGTARGDPAAQIISNSKCTFCHPLVVAGSS
jgi:hypothetical protein